MADPEICIHENKKTKKVFSLAIGFKIHNFLVYLHSFLSPIFCTFPLLFQLELPELDLFFCLVFQIRTFRGHENRKNFVGLSASGDYLACGSETNEVVVYHTVRICNEYAYLFGRKLPLQCC